MLLLGWSFLEGVGAALILPAIVALVAGELPGRAPAAAYGLVAAAGAMAVAVGPLIGGFATTYFSWRWVFAGEVVIVLAILVLARRMADAPASERPRLDLVGAGALGARARAVRLRRPAGRASGAGSSRRPAARRWVGLSPTIWLDPRRPLRPLGLLPLGGPASSRRARSRSSAAALLRNRQLNGGLTMFFFQYLVQAGVFFVVPLYLSVALGLSAIDTGVRILPLSLTLLAAAIGDPAALPERLAAARRAQRPARAASPARSCCSARSTSTPGPEVVLVPLLLIGLGIGALASQLGAVTVSAVPDEQSPEVGGVQNTMTNLGASIGTALAGSILIATLSAVVRRPTSSTAPRSRPAVKSQAQVELGGGVPFISDADLNAALDEANVPPRQSDAAVSAYQEARISGLQSALAVLAIFVVIALFLAQKIPTRQPGAKPTTA